MQFDDEEVIGQDVVRSFVVTGGRTQSNDAIDLKFETLVELSGLADRRTLRFERLDITRVVGEQEVISVAEISAALRLPSAAVSARPFSASVTRTEVS